MKPSIAVHWFRRDLRLEDNTGLYHALNENDNVLPLFIFDKNILDAMDEKSDARVQFILKTIQELRVQLQKTGSDMLVEYGEPLEVWKKIIRDRKSVV